MADEKSNRIVIYQIIGSINFDDLDLAKKGYKLEYNDANNKLFLQLEKKSRPEWAQYLDQYLTTEIDKILNRHSSFVLLIKHTHHVYALAGGQGYIALKGLYDDEFGLNVALRMITDSAEISSINQRSMKGVTRQLFRTVAGYEPLFDRDNYNRILKRISGKATFQGKTFSLSGRTSLVLRTKKDITKITDVIDEIEEILKCEEKIHFPKSYKVVKDDDAIKKLNNNLFSEFKKYWENDESRGNIYLEFDDPLIQFKCAKYKITYQRKSIELEDFDLDLIKEKMKANGVLSLDNIDCFYKFKVTGIGDAGHDEVKNETFFDMLVFETYIDTVQYIKFGKVWFEILNEIQNHLNEELLLMNFDKTLLPDWNLTVFPREEQYTADVAKLKSWQFLDQDFIYIEGRSKIELCDLFDPINKMFFHVKKTWGCKSAYLYTQAATAAESYRQSKVFREKCAKQWPKYFTDEIKDGTIVIGIAAEEAQFQNFPKSMTYFAKLNLYNAIALIKQNNFNVVLASIVLRH